MAVQRRTVPYGFRGADLDRLGAPMTSPRRPATAKASARARTAAPIGNRMLAALPVAEFRRLQPALVLVPLRFRQVLFRAGEPVQNVFFPASGVCSLVTTMEDGRAVEVACIGREGMLGVAPLLGGELAPASAVVQIAGASAYMMPVDRFTEEMNRRGPLYDLVRRYCQVLMASVMQTAACNGLHTAHQRCARWLLQTADRLDRDRFEVTQEMLALMLGVRRATVTLIAADLARAGLIAFQRRRITILDRPGLEELSCECYGVIKSLSPHVR